MTITTQSTTDVQRKTSSQISERAQACIEWLRDYANRRINSRLIDERRCIPPYIVLDFGNQGLMAMQVPASFGGKLELSLYDTLKVQQQIAAIDLTLSFFVGSNNILGVQPILKFATPVIQQRFLPDLAAGRKIASFALTEPKAGSNPLDIESTARSIDGGGFILNGTKMWSGSASWSSVMNVFAKQLSPKGISLGHIALCVPSDLKGIRQGPEALTTGVRGMVQNSVFFENVRIEAEQVLGQPGGGFAVASDTMTMGRLGVAATCIGGMWRALQLADRYARRRTIGSAKLIGSDLAAARIASMYAATKAAESLVDKLAQDIDNGVSVPGEAHAAAKALCSEWLWEVVDSAIQMLGGRGYIETNYLAQLMRDARITRLFEGPTDTLFIYIGRRVLETASPLFDYLATHLGAPEIAAALRNQLDRMREQWQSSFNTAQNICYAAAGEVTALYIVKACTKERASLLWLDARISRAVEGVGQQLSLDRMLPAAILEEIVSAIGDIEQAASDEDRFLDSYLKRDFL
ncbi:MAG: acyl-CoA dehydrogenase family protein [Pseudomonadota bacterium]